MPPRLQVYETSQIRVTFDPQRCIHSGRCLRALPAVFNISRARWIDPKAAAPDDVLAAVAQCPSGALRASLVTSVHRILPEVEVPATAEPAAPGTVTITVERDGPLAIEGPVRIVDQEGKLLREGDRCVLCRCGRSRRKPFCDNSHEQIAWTNGDPA